MYANNNVERNPLIISEKPDRRFPAAGESPIGLWVEGQGVTLHDITMSRYDIIIVR